jgi:hypothetical protein
MLPIILQINVVLSEAPLATNPSHIKPYVNSARPCLQICFLCPKLDPKTNFKSFMTSNWIIRTYLSSYFYNRLRDSTDFQAYGSRILIALGITEWSGYQIAGTQIIFSQSFSDTT